MLPSVDRATAVQSERSWEMYRENADAWPAVPINLLV
jgi:hypothetical protein